MSALPFGLSDEAIERRARLAAQEMPVTMGILDDLRGLLIEKWASSSIDNPAHTALRERLFLAVQNIDALKGALHAALDAGKVVAFARETAEVLR